MLARMWGRSGKELPYTVGRKVNQCSHCGNQYGGLSKKNYK
jgi:hypothetical protein